MKKIILLVVILLFYNGLLFSQVAVNSNGSPPDASAGLDVNYTNKGFLPPRMTRAELNSISNPAAGLIAFCTDCGANGTGSMVIYISGRWHSIFVNDCLDTLPVPVEGTHIPSAGKIIWNWLEVPGATGYKWGTTDDFAVAEEMGTGLTKTQTGLVCNTGYIAYVWAYNSCGNSNERALTQTTSINPSTPNAGTHASSPNQIVWNWNAVDGATGYKWNITNNYTGAEDMGSGLAKTERGLSCDSVYTRYVWAYNTCGKSTNLTVIQSTLQIPFTTSPSEATHIPTSSSIKWNWHPVAGAVGYKWNTTSDYESATQMGTDTTKLETGLDCYVALTRYAWTYDNCGASTPTSMSMSTTFETPSAPVAGTHVPTAAKITWKWNFASGATGYKFGMTDNYDSATDIGNTTFYIESGLNCDTTYTRYVWGYNNCTNSNATALTQITNDNLPGGPGAGTHIPSYTQIMWYWNEDEDATGYKWNTADDYGSAIDVGADTSRIESNLTCNTSYTCYVWSYNSCGHSTSIALTESTLTCWTCGNPLTINHVAGNVAPVDKTVTYGTVTNVPGETTKCWITGNLGADHQATAKDDATEASAGWYWQFDKMQGYKHDGTVRTPDLTWVTYFAEYSDWSSANDPCTLELGTGWRIPTKTEWINVDATGSWGTWLGPWGSLLKMHAAGYLSSASGALTSRGMTGGYWSTGQATVETAFRLNFNSGVCSVSATTKTSAFTIRCVK